MNLGLRRVVCSLLIFACLWSGCTDDAPTDIVVDPPVTEAPMGDYVSLGVGQPGWTLTRFMLYDAEQNAVPLPPGEAGHRLNTAWVDSETDFWIGYDAGRVYRSEDGGESWQLLSDGYEVPDFVMIDLSLRRPIPRQFVRAPDGSLYLATIGRGLLRFDEDADGWVDGTWKFDLNGSAHPMAYTAGLVGDAIWIGFVNPKGIIPPEYESIFGELVRRLDGPDADAVQIAVDEHVRIVVDIADRDGRPVIATMGNGIFGLDGDDWSALGPDPTPADLRAVDVSDDGHIAAVTTSGDVWSLDGADWQRLRCGGDGARAADLRWDGEELLVALGAELETVSPVAVQCPERGGAEVLLSFSQHTNLYHSYRGDTNDSDGFGKDINIIRSTIEIFDRHPDFHNDWDIENMFSLDDWLVEYAPDILEDIARRVGDGQDGIRLMSDNNGLMAAETAAEFAASVERAKTSLEAFVPGLWTPGVQPQENTYTPAHLPLYRELGIEWMTLFYSATSFTGFRHEIPLTLAEAHGVLTLESDLYPEATMKLVPVYHHADIIGHGGLANWLHQLHQNLDGTAVLAIHFDADSETWLGFENELEAVEEMGVDWVRPARLQDIVAEVEPAASVTIRRDPADGAFDGFSSWTEKPVNHRFYTRVVRSRLAEQRARALAGTLTEAMETHLEAAFEARLRSLSTTHFGLANPDLHPDREAAGEEATVMAEEQALLALDLALDEAAPLSTPAVFNLTQTDVTFLQPIATSYSSEDPEIRTLSSSDGSRSWLAGSIGAGDRVDLDRGDMVLESGAVTFDGWGPNFADAIVLGPRIRVANTDYPATIDDVKRVAGNDGEVITVEGDWELGDGGSVRYDWIRFETDPDAWWVEVTLTYPTVEEDQVRWWDDAVPLAIQLAPSSTWTVQRPLVTGEVASYTVAETLDALNNHAADGWINLISEHRETGFSITTFVELRAAPAFAPLRLIPTERGAFSLVVMPFSALWGELPDHRAQSLLGSSAAEYATRLTGTQLRPTAPAWNGVTTCFLLRIQPDTAVADYPQLSGARDGVLVVDTDGPVGTGRADCF